jgi:uncharacterized Zn-finger protein
LSSTTRYHWGRSTVNRHKAAALSGFAAGTSVMPAPQISPGMTMSAFETVEISEMVAACSGSGGPLGHPRVYLNLAPSGRIECPYCSRTFVNPAVAAAGGVAPEPGVVMPSGHAPGGEQMNESPAPRQVGAAGGMDG